MAIALFPFKNPITRGDRVLGRNRDAHVHMVWHEVSFHNLTLLLLRQCVEDRAQLAPESAEDHFPSSFGHEHYVILAVPFGMG